MSWLSTSSNETSGHRNLQAPCSDQQPMERIRKKCLGENSLERGLWYHSLEQMNKIHIPAIMMKESMVRKGVQSRAR